MSSLLSGAAETQKVLAIAREALGQPELQLELSTDWKSGTRSDTKNGSLESVRKILRQTIATRLGSSSHDVLDLKSPPTHPDFAISVSHCPLVGGFAYIKKPLSIGFDIEEEARVNDAIVTRIKNERDDLANAPSAAHFWSAKEALYKCLRFNQQPSVIASVASHSWTQTKPQIFTFQGARVDSFPDPIGYGVAFKIDQLVYSFFVQTSLN